MSNLLSDLAKSITERPAQVQKAQHQPARTMHAVTPLVRKGPGGTLFNFSGPTGNPLVDSYNVHLQRHADPQQAEIAKGQANEFHMAINDFVTKGEHAFNSERMAAVSGEGVDSQWNEQLSGNTDQQVIQAFKKGILDCNEGQTNPGGGGFNLPRGQFSKSTIKMGGEEVTATSETDAAIIEMMKSGGAEFE